MNRSQRQIDRLQLHLEASEKAYMNLLRDYTELKEEKENLESIFVELRDFLDYLIDNNYGSEDPKQEEKGCYTTDESISRGPRVSD